MATTSASRRLKTEAVDSGSWIWKEGRLQTVRSIITMRNL